MSSKLVIVPTIDVEGTHGRQPFEQLVLGNVDASPEGWGVLKQAELFNRYGIQATFFVDVYEYTFWGESTLARTCTELLELGQDVQLHTHPSWRDDVHDAAWLRALKQENSFYPQHLDLMAKLTYSQQVEVLERGIELLDKWIGRRPVAHRSGGYSINEDTVRALVDVGISLDSSMHVHHPNSQVAWSTNRLVRQQGLLELPITVLRQTLEIPLGGKRAGTLYSKILNTDLDCCRLHDFLGFVAEGVAQNVRILNLFMHSYSLLKFDPFFRSIDPDPCQVHKLDRLLASLTERTDTRFMSCAEILEAYRQDPTEFDGSEAIPEVAANLKILKMAAAKISNTVADSAAHAIDRFRPRTAC